MTPSRPEPRTAEERAVSIIEEIKQYFDTFRLPIDRQNAYKLSAQKCIEHQIQQAMDEARAEGFGEGRAGFHGVPGSMKSYYAQGFSDCRERAIKLFPCVYSENYGHNCPNCTDAKVIRALTLSEGER